MNPLDTRTLDTLDWQTVLQHLSSACRTHRGATHALNLPLVQDGAACDALYTAVQEVEALEETGERIPVGSVGEIEPYVRRTEQGQVLDAVELAAVGSTLNALDDLRIWLMERDEEGPLLADQMQAMSLDPELTERLIFSFDDKGQLSESMYPELAELRERIISIQRNVTNTLERLLRDPEMQPLLQDRFITQRSDRFVLPIKVDAKRKGLGIVHDTSSSGETLFIEPAEIVELNNRLRIAQSSLERAIRRILVQLSALVGRYVEPIMAALDLAVQVDLACARMQLGRTLRGTIPERGRGGVIHLLQARHPVLALRGLDVVANDLDLNAQQRGLILSGPNTGGKTVALKTLGLAALFVRAGIPFPAETGSRIDLFSDVIADIGDLQSVEGDLSTFSGHLLVLQEILTRICPGTLCLARRGRRRNRPNPGCGFGARCVGAGGAGRSSGRGDHPLHRPEGLRGCQPPVRQRSGWAGKTVNPTTGSARTPWGSPTAFSTARRLGMDPSIVDHAESLIDETQVKAAALLEELEAQRAEIDKLHRDLSTKRINLARREKELERAKANVERRAQQLAEREAKGALSRIQGVEDQVKALVAALQKDPNLRDAGCGLKGNPPGQRPSQGPISGPLPPYPSPPDPSKWGDRVRMRGVGRVGVVSSKPRKGRVELEVGGLKVKAKLAELVLLLDTPKPKARPSVLSSVQPRSTVEAGAGGVRTQRNTLDLRGHRAEEALEETSRFLDRMLQTGEPVGWVLHGHGTGVLKKALRTWLPKQKEVEKFRPANADEGGDAYTRVELR